MANEIAVTVRVNAAPAEAEIRHLKSALGTLAQPVSAFQRETQQMLDAVWRGFQRTSREADKLEASMRRLTKPTGAAGSGIGSLLGSISGSAYGAAGIAGAAVAGAAVLGSVAQTGFQQYQEGALAQRNLANAALRTNTALDAQVRSAGRLADELGLTTAQAKGLEAASLRYVSAIGQTANAEKFVRALGDAIVATGHKIEELPDYLQRLQGGGDVISAIGPVQVGSQTVTTQTGLYKAYAEEILHVKGELTDLQKVQAEYNAVLQAGAAAQGQAQASTQDAAGGYEAAKNAIVDLTGAMVAFTIKTSGAERAIVALKDAAQGLRDLQEQGITNPVAGAFSPPVRFGSPYAGQPGLSQDSANREGGLRGNATAFGGFALNAYSAVAGAAARGIQALPELQLRAFAGQIDELDNKLAALRAKNTGLGNPIAGMIAEGRLEAQRLFAELEKLPALLGRAGGGLLVAEGQRLSGGLAGAYAGGVGQLVALQERQAQFRQTPGYGGYRTVQGFYGQDITVPEYGGSFQGETSGERIQRILDAQAGLKSDLYAGLTAFDEPERRAISARFARQAALQGLAGYSPKDFNAQQEADYREILRAAEQDVLEQNTLALNETKKIGLAAQGILTLMAGDAEGAGGLLDTLKNLGITVVIQNESDKKARLGTPIPTISGNTLSNL